MYKYLLVLLLSINVSFASTVKLVEYVVSSSGLIEILGKQGIRGDDAKQVQSYVASSLIALTKKEKVTEKDVSMALNLLPPGKEASALKALLAKDIKEVKKADVVEAVNNLIYLANRYGKSVVITCADCVNDRLAKDGFKFAVSDLKGSQVQKMVNNLPTDPDQLRTYIRNAANSLNVGDYNKVAPGMVGEGEEKTLALFLAYGEKGTAAQKAFFKAASGLSPKGGMFDPKNPNKLWRLASSDMDDDALKEWTKLFNEMGAIAKRDGLSPEDAFYRELKDQAGSDPQKLAAYNTLKAKRCFFK